MMAMGTPRAVVRSMIVAEGAFLALLCGALGVVLGVATIVILDRAGVTVDVEAFRWMVGGSRLVARVSGTGALWTMVLLTTIVGACGLHPASRAARLSPVEAIRRGGR
jgi:ABC-type lipoprotein release transport system permease subunit